jgi:hypothetical protein
MKLAQKILEAKHFNTKVRQLEGMGSRKIRLTLKESKRMIESMMDPSKKSPNPKGDLDKIALQESMQLLDQAMIRLKSVKEKK